MQYCLAASTDILCLYINRQGVLHLIELLSFYPENRRNHLLV